MVSGLRAFGLVWVELVAWELLSQSDMMYANQFQAARDFIEGVLYFPILKAWAKSPKVIRWMLGQSLT